MDFLGDVVCGGFATPLARSLSEEVILVTSNDRQSIFTANNICRANNYFRTVGGTSRLLGLIINRDDGSGVAEKYAKAAGINVLMKVPYNTEARNHDDRFDFAIRIPEIKQHFEQLATAILENTITPSHSAGLEFRDFIQLFGEVSDSLPRPATKEELFSAAGSAPEGNASRAGEQEDNKILECISQLEPSLRKVYLLHEKEGKSTAEIAAQLHSTEPEAALRLKEAQKALRALFFQL